MDRIVFQLSWMVHDQSGVKSTSPSLGFWDCLGLTQRIRVFFKLEKIFKILKFQNSGWKRPPRLSQILSKCHAQLFLGHLQG